MTPVAVSDYWDEKYLAGHRQRYPWDIVVSFLFRSATELSQPHQQLSVLEVGFGSGANLWFAAREGFQVAGVEFSTAAVDAAQKRFTEDGLIGDLRQGDFRDLPFQNDTFDLIIDRAALTCTPYDEILQAIDEIARVAKTGAKFLFNCYADSHSSAGSGVPGKGRVREGITNGSLAGLDRIAFLTADDVVALFAENWTLQSMRRMESREMLPSDWPLSAEWRVIAVRR